MKTFLIMETVELAHNVTAVNAEEARRIVEQGQSQGVFIQSIDVTDVQELLSDEFQA